MIMITEQSHYSLWEKELTLLFPFCSMGGWR